MARVIPEAVKRAAAKREDKPKRPKLTERTVSRLPLPPHGEQVDYYDDKPLRRGLLLCLRVSYGGAKTWRVGYYLNGRPKAATLGRYPEMSVKQAKEAAYAFDPVAATAAARAGSFKDVAEQWLARNRHLRTWAQLERMLRVYVYPVWSNRPFAEIRRSDVHQLLDKVEEHGKPQADRVLGVIRNVMHWWSVRDE